MDVCPLKTVIMSSHCYTILFVVRALSIQRSSLCNYDFDSEQCASGVSRLVVSVRVRACIVLYLLVCRQTAKLFVLWKLRVRFRRTRVCINQHFFLHDMK